MHPRLIFFVHPRLARWVLLAGFVAGNGAPGRAQGTTVWGGTGTDFKAGASWVSGAAPVTRIAVFNLPLAQQPSLTAAHAVEGLRITGTAGVFTLAGTGPLTLGASGLDYQATSSVGSTVSVPLVLGAAATFSNAGSLTISGSVNTNGFALTLGGSGASSVLSGVISGAGSLTKTGPTTWVLSGANTYTGTTTLSQGMLVNSGSAPAGAVTIASGARLTEVLTFAPLALPGNVTGAGAFVVSSAEGASNLLGQLNSNAAYRPALLTLTGTNTFAGGVTISDGAGVKFGAASLGTGTIVLDGGLLQWAPGNTGDISSRLVFGGPTAAGLPTGVIDTNGNNVIFASALHTTAANVAAGGLIKVGTGTLTLGAAYAESDFSVSVGVGTVKLGAANALGPTAQVALRGSNTALDLNNLALTTGSVSVQAATGEVKLGTGALTVRELNNVGTISGAGSLTIQDGNTFTHLNGLDASQLAGAGTFTGGLNVVRSTAEFYSGAALGAGNIALDAGTLRWSGAATNVLDVSGRLTALPATGGSFDIPAGRNVAFASPLTGSGGFTKLGDGILTLNAANTNAGVTTIQEGTLVFSMANNFGAGGVQFANGGNLVPPTLQWAPGNTTDISAWFHVGDTVGFLDTNGNDVTFASPLTSFLGVGFAKTGAGTLTLAAADNYGIGGRVAIFGGVVQINHADVFGGGDGIELAGGTLRWGPGLTLGAFWSIIGTGTVDTNGNNHTYAVVNSAEGYLTKAGAGTFTVTGDTPVEAVTGGTLQVGAGGTFGTIASRNGLLTIGPGAMLVFNRSNDLTFTGRLEGAGTLVKNGAGKLTLITSPAPGNLHTAPMTINAGILTASIANAFDAVVNIVVNGGAWDLGGLNQGINSLSGAGGVTLGGNAATRLTVGRSGATSMFDGAISGSGGVIKTGAGVFTLAGSNSFGGGLMLAEGQVRFSSDANLGAASGGLAFNGGTLAFTGASAVATNRAVALAGSGTLLGSAAGARWTLGGVFSGGGSLTFGGGAGTVALTGANTYTGNTMIAAGVVQAGNSGGSAFGTGAVTVAAGATLTGGGGFSGPLTLQGTIAPGDAAGFLATGPLTLAGGAIYLWDLADTLGGAGVGWDRLNVGGALTFNATPVNPFHVTLGTVDLVTGTAGSAANFDPTANYAFDFILASSIVGFDPAAVTVGTSGFASAFGGTWSVAQNGGTLQLVYTGATAIPEPAAWAAIVGAMAGAIGMARRRRARR